MSRPRLVWNNWRDGIVYVECISVEWPNFSPHTGYNQLVKHLEIFSGGPQQDRPDMGAVLRKLSRHLYLDHASMQHYTNLWLLYELIIALSMIPPMRKRIYHLLYGDISYRYLGKLSRFCKQQLVVTFHQPLTDVAQQYWRRESLRCIDAAIVVGREQIPFFQSILGSQRVFHIPLGVDTRFFCPDEGSKPIHNLVTCLFVGSHYRDFTTLHKLMQSMLSSDLPIRFEVITDPADVARFAGMKNVKCHTRIAEGDLLKLYRSSDILVEPLTAATANNAILEGIACGLPIVATDVGDVRNYLDPNCAILVPPRNVTAMKEAIMTLTQDEALRMEMGKSGRQRSLEFDWRSIASRVVDVYHKVSFSKLT